MLGASEIARQFVASGDGSFVLPVIAYYSTDRLWAQVPKKDLSKEDFSSSRTKGYEQALHASANSARIVSWFRKLSLWEWQNKTKSPEYNAVKKQSGRRFAPLLAAITVTSTMMLRLRILLSSISMVAGAPIVTP